MKRGAVVIVLLTMILLAGCEQGEEQRQDMEADVMISETAAEVDQEESYWYPRGDPIDGQSFALYMEPIGEVFFASHRPGAEAGKNGDAVFLVEKNGVVWQQLEGITENNIREDMVFVSVVAVSFTDSNQDGFDDILLICHYIRSRTDDVYEIRYYQGSETGSFTLERELSTRMTETLKDPTIAEVRIYLSGEFGFLDEEYLEKNVMIERDMKEGP